MNLTRRGLLGGLLAVVSAPAIVRVESLMVLPAPAKNSHNNLRTIQLFMNSNSFIKSINEQYEHEFAVEGARIGDALRIRLPSDFAMARATNSHE
jgi:hypothetical protein